VTVQRVFSSDFYSILNS